MTMYPTLTCSSRTGTGTNSSRQLRHQGLIPASVYGHGDPVSLVLELRQLSVMLHESSSGSQLVNLLIDGKDSGLALVKSVQREAIKQIPLHLDLQRISLKEKLQVTVTVVLEGEAAGVAMGGMLDISMHTLHIRSAAGTVPDNVKHDISAMMIGDILEAGAIELPKGCELLDNPTECVAHIRQPLRVVAEAAPEETVA